MGITTAGTVITARWEVADAIAALGSGGSAPGSGAALERASQWPQDNPSAPAGVTLAEARRLVERGWPEMVGQIRVIPHITSAEVRRPVKVRGFSGSFVDMGRYSEGRPDCMVGKRRRMAPKRLVNIGVDLVNPWIVTPKQYIATGRSVLSLVTSLKARGYPCEVWGCWGMRSPFDNRWTLDARVRIQSSASTGNASRLAFWLAHPAATRRALFALVETLPTSDRERFGFYIGGGYATAEIGLARESFGEWAPAAVEGPGVAEAWAREVLGRRS